MAIPNNPVRLFNSGNLGSQKITGGTLDLINVFKQVVNGTFTDIQATSVVISGGKATLTFTADHGLFPYQVIKLTGTSSAMENKEFFVLNDTTYSPKVFSIDLTGETGGIPNNVTVKLPSLGWSIVEDSTDWFSFRPSVDNRIPLMRISKTATNPQPNTRRIYEAYLARDVNMDGSLIKNYTPTQWIGSNYSTNWGQAEATAWTVVADSTFMYIFFNRPFCPYGNDPTYSFHNSNSFYWLCTPNVCWQYGVPTLLIEDDVPREWVTLFNPSGTEFRDAQTIYYDNYRRRGYLDMTTNDNTFLYARVPYDFSANWGYAKSGTWWTSSQNGFPYPTFGAYGLITAKDYVALQGKGYYGVRSGMRCFLADIANWLRGARTPVAYGENKIHRDALSMGILEVNAVAGKQPVLLVLASVNGYVAGTDPNSQKNTGFVGIRLGCSWKEADLGGV